MYVELPNKTQQKIQSSTYRFSHVVLAPISLKTCQYSVGDMENIMLQQNSGDAMA